MQIGDIIWRGLVVIMVGALIAMQIAILQRTNSMSATRPLMETEEFAVRIAVATAASVVLVMVFGLVVGLFDPKVDNDKIFPILSDGFKTSLGALIVMMSGIIKNRPGKANETPTRRDDMTDAEADLLGLPDRLTPEEEAAEEKEQAEKREEQRLFLYRLMRDPEFRTWLWGILTDFGTFTNTFACGPTGFPDAHATFFSLGLKQAGLNLLEIFDNATPDLVSLMRREATGVESLSLTPSGRVRRRVIVPEPDEQP